MAKLEDELFEAKKIAMPTLDKKQEDNLKAKAAAEAAAFKNFLLKMDLRVVELETEADFKHMKTSSGIDTPVKTDTLMGPNGIYISFFKSVLNGIKDVSVGGISPFSPIVNPILSLISKLEQSLSTVVDKVAGEGVTIKPLNLQEGKDGGAIDFKCPGIIKEDGKKKNPSGLAKKSKVVFFEGDIKRNDK
jgi:hypothetical protein